MTSSALNTVTIPHDRAHAIDLLQITDTHLGERPHTPLLAMDTDDSLQAVLSLARRTLSNVDLVVATGDLSDQGALDAYLRLYDYTRNDYEHQFWLLGNHDDAEMLTAAASQHERLLRNDIRIGCWQILMLNSQIPGEVGGRLGAAELTRLRLGLEQASAEGLYTLICVHHQPVPVGSAWIDSQAISDATELFAIIDAFPAVRALLWGHVHQEVDQMRGDLRLLASPSTCVQFLPGSETFKLDNQTPGFRHLTLHPDGSLSTRVHRVTDRKFTVDLSSSGYL